MNLERMAGAGPQKVFMPGSSDPQLQEMRRSSKALRKVVRKVGGKP